MSELRTVAALYVDRLGPYPKLPGVDCWDLSRDARLYDGPHPIVAHPPCGPWSHLRHLYRGSENDCALRALEQVRRFGGVLEHPAHSQLWNVDGADANPKSRGSQYMARPGELPDCWGGVSIEVDQCDFGHPARKKTWLYLIRVDGRLVKTPPKCRPTHWCSGGRTKRPGMGATVPPGIKVCSAQQRRRTPLAFAEWLVALARSVAQTPSRIERNAS